MHPDANFHNGSGASRKWRETFESMSFGPKEVDWACSLLETRNSSGGINTCIKCTSIPVFSSNKECVQLLFHYMLITYINCHQKLCKSALKYQAEL